MNKQHIDWELNQSKIYIEAVIGTFGYWQNEPERQNEKFRSVLAEIGDETLQKQLQQEIITHFPNNQNSQLFAVLAVKFSRPATEKHLREILQKLKDILTPQSPPKRVKWALGWHPEYLVQQLNKPEEYSYGYVPFSKFRWTSARIGIGARAQSEERFYSKIAFNGNRTYVTSIQLWRSYKTYEERLSDEAFQKNAASLIEIALFPEHQVECKHLISKRGSFEKRFEKFTCNLVLNDIAADRGDAGSFDIEFTITYSRLSLARRVLQSFSAWGQK
jgi:hypothetical protein